MSTLNSILLNATDSLNATLSVTNLVGGTAQNIASAEMNEIDQNLNASSTVDILERAMCAVTLDVSGEETLDLTAFDDSYLGTVDLSSGAGTTTALRPKFVKFTNQGSNKVIITEGGSNPYYFTDTDTWKITLPAGASVKFRLNNEANLVGSGAKTIKIAGTQDDVVWVCIYAGY
jgi:hypothetical protein